MRFFRFFSAVAAFLICSPAVTLAQTDIEKAEKLYELRSFKEAAVLLGKLVAKQPDNGLALSRLGDCYFYTGDLPNAVATYKRAVMASNVPPSASLQLGKVLMLQGNYSEAQRAFNGYAKISPDLGKHFADYAANAGSGKIAASNSKVELSGASSTASDFGAHLSGGKLYFSSARTDKVRKVNNNGSSFNGQGNQLFQAKLDAAGKTVSVDFVKSDLQNTFNEGPISLSADGRFAAYTKNTFNDETRLLPLPTQGLTIFFAGVDGASWSEGKSFPHNSGTFSNAFPSLSPDGKTMYFCSNRPEGKGGFDIYVSYKKGESWSYPENLEAVNTSGDEICPFLDGSVLYFASDYWFGLGGFDIFKSTASGGNWSKPANLGAGINSSGDDFSFCLDKANGVAALTSNRAGGKGKEDLYIATQPMQTVSLLVLGPDGKPVPTAMISGDCTEKTMATAADGKFSTKLKNGQSCKFKVSKVGFKDQVITLGPSKTSATVNLAKAGDMYKGVVLDFSTKQPIRNALVIAKIGKDKKSETLSNDKGEFTISVEPGHTYSLVFSAVGHVDLNREVEAKGKLTPTDLGNIVLLSPYDDVADAGGPKEVLPPKPPTTTGSGTSTGTTSPITPAKPDTAKALPPSYFAIQLRSQPTDGPLDLSEFDSIKSLGVIYIVPEGGKNKVRLGLFASRDQAVIVGQKVKNKGFKDAFVAAETNAEIVKKYGPKAQKDAKLRPKGAEDVPTEYKAKTTRPEVTLSPYRVKLGAFAKDSSIRREALGKLGTLEETKQGKLTLVSLTGFTSKVEALKALEEAKKLGYTDAYLTDK